MILTLWLNGHRGFAVNTGVFVCGCNESISSNIDTERVAQEAGTLEDVSFVDNQAHFCAPSSAVK